VQDKVHNFDEQAPLKSVQQSTSEFIDAMYYSVTLYTYKVSWL